MNEERQYGLEDGYADAERGKAPEVDLTLPAGSEYDMAYVEGYQRWMDEQGMGTRDGGEG